MERSREPTRESLVRRDAEGAMRTAPSWETLTERLIREAQADGHFDDLPGHGRPLKLDDVHFAGEMALAHHLLHNAGVAPPWIETDKEARGALAAIEALLVRARGSGPASAARLGAELEAFADAHDEAADRLERLAPTIRQHRTQLDRPRLRRRLEMALATERGPS